MDSVLPYKMSAWLTLLCSNQQLIGSLKAVYALPCLIQQLSLGATSELLIMQPLVAGLYNMPHAAPRRTTGHATVS